MKTIVYNSVVFLVLLILSIIFHYVYEWCNYNKYISYFVPINESIWEHLKLLYFPALLVLLLEFSIFKYNKKYYVSSILSLSISMLSIIVLYYTITGVIGMNIDVINIGIMIISIILYLYLRRLFYKINLSTNLFLSITLTIMWFLYFILFTYNPPNLGLFGKLIYC